jgi:hypothetical protein
MRTLLTSKSWKNCAARMVRDALAPSAARRKMSETAKPLPNRRTQIEQWSRVIGILIDAQSQTHRALESHKSASAQLDAATYALQRLREEIAPAFVFTGVRSLPPQATSTAFRREQFRRREPIAA